MAQIEDLKALDLDKVKPELLKTRIKELLSDYQKEEDKTVFNREAKDNISKVYELVKKYCPQAIVKEEAIEATEKQTSKKKKKGVTKTEPEAEPEQDHHAKARKEISQKAMAEVHEIGKEIEACRQVIKEYNKKKKEAEGKEPVKKTRLTKLKEKLLGIAGLIPDKLKADHDVRDKTEKILLDTLSEIKKAWEMNIIKPAQEAIKEKFIEMEGKHHKKEA